jgi:hypothetical protein
MVVQEMNITNNCNFCHKALELQGALDLGLISERNRCNDKIASIEYEKQVLSDRLGHAELGYINFVNFLLAYFDATEEQEDFFCKKLEYFNNKAIKEAMQINKPIDRN